MKLISGGALLLFAALAFGQQQGHPPYSPPPYSTPPTFPQDHKPTDTMPPDTKAPLPESKPNTTDVQEQIQNKLDTEPLLSDAHVKASANESSVVLAGVVENEQQHDLAMRIAQSYAGDRNVDDQVQVLQQS